jgi:hypothetical protein
MLALKHDANALLTLQTQVGDQLALPKSAQRDRLCRSGLVSEPAVGLSRTDCGPKRRFRPISGPERLPFAHGLGDAPSVNGGEGTCTLEPCVT